MKSTKVIEGGVVSGLLRDVKIPGMFHVRQTSPREVVSREETAGAVDQQLNQERFAFLTKPGMRVAVMVGSRGIQNVDIITKAIVDLVKGRRAVPSIVPVIRSHGGVMAEGQLEILASYDITLETMRCLTRSSMGVMELGALERDKRMFIDRNAYEADGIIILCRLKPHDASRGAYESGPCKMMTMGFGKQEGAGIVHSDGMDATTESIFTMARVVLEKAKILLAIPRMENVHDETCRIETILAQDIMEREPELLKHAFPNTSKLMVRETDVLVADEIGKNYSDTGVDPNITGISPIPYATGGIRVQRTCFLNLSQANRGNVLGCGLASAITKKIFDQMDIEKMYPDCVTSTVLASARIPCVVAAGREAPQLCIRTCNKIDRGRVRVVRIANSLHIGEVMLSEACYKGVEKGLYPGVEALDEPRTSEFDELGNLITLAGYMAMP